MSMPAFQGAEAPTCPRNTHTLKETLIESRVRARVAFACEQGAVTAVQSFCTKEPQRRSHARF